MKEFIVIVGGCLLIALSSLLSSCDGKSFEEDMAITLEQKKLLDKFKAIVKDRLPLEYMEREDYLIKWLRENYFNIDEAEKGLMAYVQWREDNKMDGIFKEDWSGYERDFPYHLESRDKEGRPIVYFSATNWDFRKAAVQGSQQRFNRYLDKLVDDACKEVRALGEKYKNVSQGVLIINISGFNLVQHGCLQCIASCLRVLFSFENHYPGYIEKIILVNVPQMAHPMINVAKTALRPSTRASLMVFGADRKKWQKQLYKYIDEDQLPPELGGTMIYAGSEDYENYT